MKHPKHKGNYEAQIDMWHKYDMLQIVLCQFSESLGYDYAHMYVSRMSTLYIRHMLCLAFAICTCAHAHCFQINLLTCINHPQTQQHPQWALMTMNSSTTTTATANTNYVASSITWWYYLKLVITYGPSKILILLTSYLFVNYFVAFIGTHVLKDALSCGRMSVWQLAA